MKQTTMIVFLVIWTAGLASAQVYSSRSQADRLFSKAEEKTLTTGNPEEDTDLDGILNKNDACPESKENYNFFEDEDGCEDVLVDYFDFVEFFSGIEAFENGEINNRGRRELEKDLVKLLKDFPETHWIVEVEGSNVEQSLNKAERIISLIESEFQIHDRLSSSVKKGVLVKYKFILDTEKAKEIALKKMQEAE